MDLNRFLCTGRLTRDPELRYTPQGTAVSRFDVAVNRPGRETEDGKREDEVLFLPVVAWGKTAENVNVYLTKGSRVAVDGRLELNRWQTKEGEKRKVVRLIAQSVVFLDSKKTAEGQTPEGEQGEHEPDPEPVPF